MSDPMDGPSVLGGTRREAVALIRAALDELVNAAGGPLPPERTFPSAPLQRSELREHLGRIVRETWVICAGEQADPKPSHLAGWDELDEWDKEVDRRIGDAVASEVARLMSTATCEKRKD
jgi:hypothetical protein